MSSSGMAVHLHSLISPSGNHFSHSFIHKSEFVPRIYFGIGCELNRQLCYTNLIKAAFHPDADASLKATAHAAIVAWLLDCTEELRGRYLYGAMHHANKAIQYSRPLCVLGHSIPTVAWQTRHLFRPMSERVVELNFFYNNIWQAEREAEERIQRDSEANILRMKNPLRYKCANYGCGIEADRGKMLQKCTQVLLFILQEILLICLTRWRQM